jgi:Ion channel
MARTQSRKPPRPPHRVARQYQRLRATLLTPTPPSAMYLVYVLLLLLLLGFPLWVQALHVPLATFDGLLIGIVLYSCLLPDTWRVSVWTAGALMLLAVGLMLGQQTNVQHPFYPVKIVLIALFFLLFVRVLILEILFAPIALTMLYQSIASYLVLGMLFALGFRLLQIWEPGAFNFPVTDEFNPIYMSFIVLTSVGLGDMLPVTMSAKALVLLESIVGQIYLAFFVAVMIGKYMSAQKQPPADP